MTSSDKPGSNRTFPSLSLAGFKDPVRRPRYIIWTSVAVLFVAAVMIVALGATSTRWFCSEGCHKVQDDTIKAYQHSTHAQVSCMACHMPVGANPITFVMHKAEALGELYLTITNNYELPLNAKSEVALNMKPVQCEQCHNLAKRRVTPATGILIDHKVHADKNVTCGMCHNRIAHRENFEMALKDPKTGEPNRTHEDFMSMTACFRCHTHNETSPGLKAPGECTACHPADFQLKPASHLQEGFYPKGHARLGQAEAKRVASFEAGKTEGEKAAPEGKETLAEKLVEVGSINECSTCHGETFCSDCHGLPMPHPVDFKKGHGKLGKQQPKTCARCHGGVNRFCDECHHGTALDWNLKPTPAWIKQHPQAVAQKGAGACFDCHKPTYCAACHVNGPQAVR